jgi:hypothetical protein
MNTGFPSRPNGWLSSEPSKAEGLRAVDAEEPKPNDFAAALALLAGMMAANPSTTPAKKVVPVPPSGGTIPGAQPTVEMAPVPLDAKPDAKPDAQGATPEANPNETPTLELPAWMAPVEFGESVAVESSLADKVFGKKTLQSKLASPIDAGATETEVVQKAGEANEPAPLLEMIPVLQSTAIDESATPRTIAVGTDIGSAIVAALAEHNPTPSRAVSLPEAAAPEQSPSPEAATLRPVEVINDIRRAHFGKDTAEIVVGDGDSRVDLSIASQGQQVRVSAVAATPEVAIHLREHATELGTALAKHGLNLEKMSFDFGANGDSGERRNPETTRERDKAPTIATANEITAEKIPEPRRDLRAIA